MSLGVITALISAAAAVAPTVYSIVDDQQRRKKEEKQKTKEAIETTRLEHYQRAGIPAIQVPDIVAKNLPGNAAAPESKWPEWAMPVAITGGVIIFGTLVVMALKGNGSKKKHRHEDEDNDEVEEEGEDGED